MSTESTTIQAVVETSLYGDDLAAMESFYTDVLGLTVVDKDPGRHIFLRVGAASVLLLFNPSTTRQHELFPPHGAFGPGHAAFGIRADQLEIWRSRLTDHQVAIEREIDWPRGGHSIYFRDPAGNSIELITPGVWGTAAGW